MKMKIKFIKEQNTNVTIKMNKNKIKGQGATEGTGGVLVS